jgi:CHASE2 domain-containing sensor protein
MKLPKPPRVVNMLAVAVLAAIAVCVLLNLRALSLLFIPDLFEARAINYMSNFGGSSAFDPNVKIVLIEKDPHDGPAPTGDLDRKHRKFFAELIKAMTLAKAKVLAFDVSFDGKSADFDKDFGQAVREAKANGLTVIIGADSFANGKLDPEIPADFNQPEWGLIKIGSYQGAESDNGPIRAVKLADNFSGNVVPSLPLRAVMDSQSFVPELQVEWNRLLLYTDKERQKLANTVPLERGKYLLIDQASLRDLEAATVTARRIYEDLNNPEELKKKYENAIVLVGYEFGESRSVLAGGQRLGVQLHATTISNILQRVFIYKLYLIYSYVIILVMALLALVMDTRVGKRLKFIVEVRIPWTEQKVPVPLGLVIIAGIYLLIAIFVFMRWRFFLDVPYHLAALGLSYLLLWIIFTKLFPRKVEDYIRL